MRLMRIVIAGLIGGIVVFCWGFLSHTVLPIGDMGVANLPADQTLVPTMQANIKNHGFYFFPTLADNATTQQQEAWQKAYETGPRGIVIYDPTPGVKMIPDQLGSELASNVLAALIAAVVLSHVGGGLLSRAIGGLFIGAALGAFAWLSVDVSHWTWHRFPTDMVLGALLDQAIGWAAAGFFMGMIAGKPSWNKVEVRAP